MKISRHILIPIIAFFTIGTSFCNEISDEASAAIQSLSAGHPAEALVSYQSLLASPQFAKISSPEIWYNRGLAEEKTGDSVAATLSYRRALLLDPTFVPARARLNTLLGTLGIPSANDSQKKWIDLIQIRVHPDYLILGGSVLGWLGVLLLVFLVLAGPRRPGSIALAVTLFILGNGLSLFGTWGDARRVASHEGVVTAKAAITLRDTPADSAKSEGTLAPGSLITILSRNGAWSKVSDGTSSGWTSSTTVTPLLPASLGS